MAMETRLYRKAILAIDLSMMLVILFLFAVSCVPPGKVSPSENPYKIINSVLVRINSQENKIYVDMGTTNNLFIEELNTNLVVNDENKEFHFLTNFFSEDELLKVFSSIETSYMKSQLKNPFVLNMKKINVKNVVSIKNREAIDYSTIFYTLSKPVFTVNKQYSIILVYKRYSGHWIEVYKKQNKKWVFYKEILLGIE